MDLLTKRLRLIVRAYEKNIALRKKGVDGTTTIFLPSSLYVIKADCTGRLLFIAKDGEHEIQVEVKDEFTLALKGEPK